MDTTTTTSVTNVQSTTESNTVAQEEKKRDLERIAVPIFLLFAEYEGYVTPNIEWAEEWAKNGSLKETFKTKILSVEAGNIFREMLKDMNVDEIRKEFNLISSLALAKIIDEFNKKESDSTLPF